MKNSEARRATGSCGESRAISMIEPPGTLSTPGVHVGLEREELRAVDAAEGLAEVEIRHGSRSAVAVAVDVHTDLDLADELHQVDHRLAEPVAVRRRASPAPRRSTPSVESIAPSPFWSKPRPPAGTVTDGAAGAAGP